MKAIILAGGLGTRLRPLTENLPKPLLPICGKPIIEHAIANLKKHGILDIILSIGHQAEKIIDYFGDGKKFGVNIVYAIEDQPLGTGGALKQAAKVINENFIAINGDNLADFNWTTMIDEHKNNQAKISLALYPVEDVTQYGIARVVNGRILQFVEKPAKEQAPSNLNNAGGYLFSPGSLAILPNGVSSIERDCFEKMAILGEVFAFLHHGQWFPTDTLEKYQNAAKKFQPL